MCLTKRDQCTFWWKESVVAYFKVLSLGIPKEAMQSLPCFLRRTLPLHRLACSAFLTHWVVQWCALCSMQTWFHLTVLEKPEQESPYVISVIIELRIIGESDVFPKQITFDCRLLHGEQSLHVARVVGLITARGKSRPLTVANFLFVSSLESPLCTAPAFS